MRLTEKSIARLVRQASIHRVPESELLHRFLQERDQAAFELLVHRFGPMVLGLCKRLLGQHADAEDAFQATFITLACQARSITKQKSLGSWLYKVAWRMSMRQRKRRSTPLTLENEKATTLTPVQELEQKEIASCLALEVNRLSDSLRTVIVLCCLQGKSSKEAAEELGCPANTVAVRLRRAREQLKKRLHQRGYVLSTSIATTLGISSASAQLSLLASQLSHTALQVSLKGLVPSLLSPPIAMLMKGALLTMWMKPIKVATLFVVGLGVMVVPNWQGSATLQAQPPELFRLYETRGLRVNHARSEAAIKMEETYPKDENLPEDVRKLIDEQKKLEEAIKREAEQRMKGMRLALHGKLKQLQDNYTKAGDLDRAVAVRDQVRRLEMAIASAVVYQSSSQVAEDRGQNGKSFVYAVRGNTTGSVWGDGVYTDDSDLGAVAVHTGLVQPGQCALIKVIIMEGRDDYPGSTKHGVTTSAFQKFPGSMRVEKAELGTDSK